jgi:hypothetical protein
MHLVPATGAVDWVCQAFLVPAREPPKWGQIRRSHPAFEPEGLRLRIRPLPAGRPPVRFRAATGPTTRLFVQASGLI